MTIKIDDKTLFNIGYGLGYAFAPIINGINIGVEDWRVDEAAREMKEESKTEEPKVKTQLEDCQECQCNICENIETCDLHREGALIDGIKPMPCCSCENGMRFKPVEHEQCANFKKASSGNYI